MRIGLTRWRVSRLTERIRLPKHTTSCGGGNVLDHSFGASLTHPFRDVPALDVTVGAVVTTRAAPKSTKTIELQSANDMQGSGTHTQVFHKSLIGLNLLSRIIVILDAKQIGRVNGDKHAAVALPL